MKWHLQGEAFGYFFGPLLMVVTNHSKWENERTIMWLAIVTAITWFFFTVCFVEGQNSAQATREALQAADSQQDSSSFMRNRALS